MKALDGLKMHGALTLIMNRADGTVETMQKDNLIVNAGFDLICAAIGNAGARPAVVSHIAVGTNNTAAAAAQTALVAELTRVAATYAHTAGTKVFTMTATFAAGVATGALVEAGVLNAASGGVMLDRVVFPVINKGADDSLTAVFTFTLS